MSADRSGQGTQPEALVRGFREGDCERLREICRASARESPHTLFREDPTLSTLFFLDEYIDAEPESCFVAEVDGRVVGYIAGTKDTLALERRFRRRIVPRIVLRIGWRLLTIQYRTWSIYQALWWILSGRLGQDDQGLRAPVDRYPAHSHFNVEAEHRSGGIGEQLGIALHTHLRERGVPGLHAIIYEKAGRDPLASYLCSRRGYELAATRSYDLLEKMTGQKWDLKLLLRDLTDGRT